MRTITINGFDPVSIRSAISELQAMQNKVERMGMSVCERLATLAATRASIEYARAPYNGVNDVVVVAEPFDNGWRVRASGNAVLFIEYGSGATYGFGHPNPMGFGPGTYPGKGHWADPKGWWYGHGLHSYGNPPAAAMYHAEQDVRSLAPSVVTEVINGL